MALLSITDLAVAYRTPRGEARAVDGASLEVPPGALVGLVGESGCGKTTLARAVMGVLPRSARIAGGRIAFDGADLLAMPAATRRALLWRQIAFVPQSAMNALDPVYTLRAQMLEVLRRRGGLARASADARAAELFRTVGLDPARLSHYPHQFSGGMRQRAGIAMALALRPRLLIADEPVTALDVIVQRQVLETLRTLSRELHLAAIVVTHDIGVVAYLCDFVAVMYAGRVVEFGPARAVLGRPAHPYTQGLMRAFPDLERPAAALVPIEGAPPSLLAPPPGCRFAPRCGLAEPACRAADPPTLPAGPDHLAACRRLDAAARAPAPATAA